MTEVTTVDSKFIDTIMQQLNEEIGEDAISKEQTEMLLMKYGLSAPRLTPSEKHMIIREERHGR